MSGHMQAASGVLRVFSHSHNALSRPPFQSTLSQTARFWSARQPMSVCRLYIALVDAMDGRIAALGRGRRACMRALAASPSDLSPHSPMVTAVLTFMHGWRGYLVARLAMAPTTAGETFASQVPHRLPQCE